MSKAEGGGDALQGVVSTLLSEILSLYPAEQIFTPTDLLGRGGVWPSMDELVAAGKRVSFTSGTDYGTAMAPLIFDRSAWDQGSPSSGGQESNHLSL